MAVVVFEVCEINFLIKVDFKQLARIKEKHAKKLNVYATKDKKNVSMFFLYLRVIIL